MRAPGRKVPVFMAKKDQDALERFRTKLFVCNLARGLFQDTALHSEEHCRAERVSGGAIVSDIAAVTRNAPFDSNAASGGSAAKASAGMPERHCSRRARIEASEMSCRL